jgi:inhibitor of cysteine peptidase
MKKIPITVLAMAGILFIAGCNTTNKETSKHTANISVSEGLNGRSLTIKEGDIFSIKLRGNPTTGYSWQLSSADKSILNLIEKKFIPEKKKKNIVGSGGTDIFIFEAVGSGKTDLKLIYARSWEKYAKPAKTFNLKVMVEKAE